MPLELLNVLGVGLLASGQLGHQCFLLLQLATKLTCGGLRKLLLGICSCPSQNKPCKMYCAYITLLRVLKVVRCYVSLSINCV